MSDVEQMAYQYLDVFQGPDDSPWAILVDCACKFEGTYRSIALVHRFSLPGGGDAKKARNEWGTFKQAIEDGVAIEHEIDILPYDECIAAYSKHVQLFLNQQKEQISDAPAALAAIMLAQG